MDQKKYKLIEEICEQSCYMKDSGLYCNVVRALDNVSFSDLHSLKLLIDLKVQDAVEKAVRSNKKEQL